MLRFFNCIWSSLPLWEYGIWKIEKAVEEIILCRLSEIDLGILDWTIGALGEDDKLEEFFDTISNFFNSKLVKITG